MRRELNIFSPDEARDIERKLGVVGIRDRRLLARAFVAKSAAQTLKDRVGGDNIMLALVGDTIARTVFMKHLFHRFPDHHRNFTVYAMHLLSNRNMARVCNQLGLPKYLHVVGEPDRTYEAATLFEALLFVLESDRPDGAVPVLYRTVLKDVQFVVEAEKVVGEFLPDDSRFQLAAYAREHFGATVRFSVPSEHGEGPKRHYRCLVRLGRLANLEGTGLTPELAMTDAAVRSLELLKTEVMQQHALKATPPIRSTGITVVDPSAFAPSTNGDQPAAEPEAAAASAS